MPGVYNDANQVLEQSSVSYGLVFQIEDEVGNWVDFTSKLGKERIIGTSGISAKLERTLGAYEVNLGSITVDNSDNYWNRKQPGFQTWYRKRIWLGLATVAGPPVSLGYWLIDGLTTHSAKPEATLKLVNTNRRLVDKLADRVRDGKGWHVNKSIGWLVQELLRVEHTPAQVKTWVDAGLLVGRYKIPLADSTKRALGAYGRPPEFDGSANAWRDANDPNYQVSGLNQAFRLYGNPILIVSDINSQDYGKVYVGIDFELWRWDPDIDKWFKVGKLPTESPMKSINHLFYNAGQRRVIAVAWAIDRPAASSEGKADRSGALSGDVGFYYCAATDLNVTMLKWTVGAPANVWTGHFSFRVGGYEATPGNATYMGAHTYISDAERFGINMPLPQGAWHRMKQGSGVWATTNQRSVGKAAWNSSSHRIDSDLNIIHNADDDTSRWGTEIAGYYGWESIAGTGDIRPLDARFHLGQYSGAFAHQRAGNEMAFCVIAWDNTAKDYALTWWKLNTATGVFTARSAVGIGQQVYSIDFSPDDTEILVGQAKFLETPWSGGAPALGQVESYVLARVWSTLAFPADQNPAWFYSLAFLTTEFQYGLIPLSVQYGATRQYAFCTFLDYKNVLGIPYVAAVLDYAGGSTFLSRWGDANKSIGRPSRAAVDTVNSRFYWVETGSNALLSKAVNSKSGFGLPEDDGSPPVPNDPNITAGPVWDRKRNAVYGVSGPGVNGQSDEQVMGGPLTGKYSLWQYANFLPDRIELADFSQTGDVWSSLEALAATGDFLFGYDHDDNFVFKPRTDYTGLPPSAWTTACRVSGYPKPGDMLFDTMEKDWGFDEVFNVAEIKPAAAILKEPQAHLQQLPRPATFKRDRWAGDMYVFQSNTRAQNIFLRCVRGGQVGMEDDGVVGKTSTGRTVVDYSVGSGQELHKLRFAFLLYDRVVEGQLIQAAIGGGAYTDIVVPMEAAKDVRANATDETGADTVDIAAGAHIARVTIRTDAPGSGTSTLRLVPAVPAGTTYPVGTKVILRTWGNARWSDSRLGVTTLTGATASGSEGAEVTLPVLSTADLSVGAVINVSSTSYASDYRVTAIVSATSLKAKKIGSLTGTLAINSVVKSYFAPIENADWPAGTLFYIGGTGVALKFSLPPALQDGTIKETPFMVGDEIQIECPGLVLVSQELAQASAYDKDSIAKYGKLPWPAARSSPFLNYRQAVETTRRIVKEFGKPKFRITCQGSLVRVPVVGAPLRARDPKGILPQPLGVNGLPGIWSPNGDYPVVDPDLIDAIACVVRSWKINPEKDSLEMQLRAVNPHVW